MVVGMLIATGVAAVLAVLLWPSSRAEPKHGSAARDFLGVVSLVMALLLGLVGGVAWLVRMLGV